MRVLGLLIVFSTVGVVAGCGNSSSDDAKVEAVKKGIYVSAADCAENGFLEYDVCDELIEKAIRVHKSQSPTYETLPACEAKEGGANKCERALDSKFRARLLAFELANGRLPSSKPLYPALKGEAGFRDLDGAVVLERDFEVPFSPQAVAAFEVYADKRKRR